MSDLLQLAREGLMIEAEGIYSLIDKLDNKFVQAVEMILSSKGRLIVASADESGIMAHKLATIFNSTGTPALVMHDGLMVSPGDVVLVLSDGSEIEKLNTTLSNIECLGASLIILADRLDSMLVKSNAVIIDVSVPRETCPLALVPMASTTATLAMGNALAVALFTQRSWI